MQNISDFHNSNNSGDSTNNSYKDTSKYTCLSLVPLKVVANNLSIDQALEKVKEVQEAIETKLSSTNISDDRLDHTKNDKELLSILFACRFFLMNKQVFCICVPDNLMELITSATQDIDIKFNHAIKFSDMLVVSPPQGET